MLASKSTHSASPIVTLLSIQNALKWIFYYCMSPFIEPQCACLSTHALSLDVFFCSFSFLLARSRPHNFCFCSHFLRFSIQMCRSVKLGACICCNVSLFPSHSSEILGDLINSSHWWMKEEFRCRLALIQIGAYKNENKEEEEEDHTIFSF